MPYVGDFDPMDSDESEFFAFDFSKAMSQVGDTIASCAWTVKKQSDETDVTSGIAVNDPIAIGRNVVQRCAGMTAGLRYVMIAKITTTRGDTLSLWGYVDSVEPS